VLTVALVWLAVDRHPPEWDYANHLEHAVRCNRDLAAGDVRGVFGHSSFYPPLVPCLAGLVFALLPSDVAFGEVVILAFLALGMAATYLLGRRFDGGVGGVVAAALYGTAPFIVHLALRFQLDVPLSAMVATSLVALLATERFERRGWAVGAGVICGLGMLTKPPFAVAVGPACLLVLAQARGRRAWTNAGIAGLTGALVALPWYGPRLLGLSAQIQNRSFKQAAEAGSPDALSAVSLTFYPLNFPVQFGLIAAALLVLGLGVVIRRGQGFVLAGLAPLAVFFVLQNKQLRYTTPLLPIAAVIAGVGFGALPKIGRAVAGGLLVIATAIQLSTTAFGVPAPVHVAGIPLTLATPPSRAEWPHRRILDLIARDGAGRSATVSIIPNHALFSAANFRYYAVRDGRSLRVGRGWDAEPIGVEYMILKTGDLGPPWTMEKARRAGERLETDGDLARVFPVIGEFPLPDGSTASVRARKIPEDAAATPDAVARGVEEGLRTRLADVTRDVEGLEIRLDYDAGILGGRIKRLEITAAAATVGELRRRQPALLRLHDLRLVVDDALVNPWSAYRARRFDPLDARRCGIERARIDAADLQTFLGQVKGFGRASLLLGSGFAELRFDLLGPDVSARVRPIGGLSDRPFVLLAERVRVGGMSVPPFLVNWVMRNFDPSAGIASRLPFPAAMGPITVTPRAILIGS
jgi:hypothetical protein